MTKPESVSWGRDGCMPNVAQSVGACTAAANCHAAEARAKRPFSLDRVAASNKFVQAFVRAFTLKGRDDAGCCCSWRTRPASGSLPHPAESDRSAWWVHPEALGSRTSGCGQILDKEALAYTSTPPYRSENKEPELLGVFARLPKHGAWSDTYPGTDHVLKPHQRCATGRGHVPKPVHPFVPF